MLSDLMCSRDMVPIQTGELIKNSAQNLRAFMEALLMYLQLVVSHPALDGVAPEFGVVQCFA